MLDSFLRELVEVDLEGRRGFMMSDDAEEAEGLEVSPGVHLLPSFDCYAMHYFPREAFISATSRHRVFSQEAGWVFPPVVVDGLAAGIWGIKKRASLIEVDIEAFRGLSSRERRGLEAEAADVGRFLGNPVELRYRPVRRA